MDTTLHVRRLSASLHTRDAPSIILLSGDSHDIGWTTTTWTTTIVVVPVESDRYPPRGDSRDNDWTTTTVVVPVESDRHSPLLYFIEGDGSGPRLTDLITLYTFKRLRGAGELAIGPAVGGPAARTFRSTTKPTAQVLVHQAKQHSACSERFLTRTQLSLIHI